MGGSITKRAKQMIKEPYIYLHARNNQRFRYDIKAQTFETCYPAKRTLISAVCCKQWQEWFVINPFVEYDLVESLKIELLTKLDY